jgi:hypothetical protein
MTVFSFRVTLERFSDVSRVIECDGHHSLHDLHRAIQDGFGWDDDHLYGFYLGQDEHDRRHEYVCDRTTYQPNPFRPASPPKRAERAIIGTLGLFSEKQFLYIFDFGDNWRHEIAVIGVDTDRNLDHPRIAERCGDAPSQYDWGEQIEKLVDSGDWKLMQEEIGPRFALIEEWREFHSTRTDSSLDGALDLARRISDSFREDFNVLIEVDDFFDWEFFDWLKEISFVHARAGRIDDAIGILSAQESIMEPEELQAGMVEIFLEAGLTDDARSGITTNLERFPKSAYVRIEAAAAFKALKEFEAAETHLKAVASDETFDEEDRGEALKALVALYEETGREVEAEEIRLKLKLPAVPETTDEDDALDRIGREFEGLPLGEPFVRAEPKVGRNEPCPCGSGKKFKKCCGR